MALKKKRGWPNNWKRKKKKKKQPKKQSYQLSVGGFEKLWYKPGNLEGHAHMQDYVYAQGIR